MQDIPVFKPNHKHPPLPGFRILHGEWKKDTGCKMQDARWLLENG
jgi:hypothetical protein